MSIRHMGYKSPDSCRTIERHLTNLFNSNDKEYENTIHVLNDSNKIRTKDKQLKKYKANE